MANPKIYWYPDGSTLRSSSLPRLSRLEVVDKVFAEDGVTGNFQRVRTYSGVQRRIRVTIERHPMMTSAGFAYYKEITAIIEHLRGGGWISFARDSDKVWAASAISPSTGDTLIGTSGNLYSAYGGSGTIVGDNAVLEATPIYAQQEYVNVTALVAGQITASAGVIFTYSAYRCILRNAAFWPKLKLPQDSLDRSNPINEHGISWSLDLTLEEDSSVFPSQDA